MTALPQPPTPMTPTSIDELEAMLGRLEVARRKWVELDTAGRATLLRACMRATAATAEQWGEVSCRVKGYALNSAGHGEEIGRAHV